MYPPGPTDVEQAFVERDTEITVDERPHLVDPRRVVEQVLEDLAPLDDVLVHHPVALLVRLDLHVADPAIDVGFFGRVIVHPLVDRVHDVRRQRLLKNEITIEIELVALLGGEVLLRRQGQAPWDRSR